MNLSTFTCRGQAALTAVVLFIPIFVVLEPRNTGLATLVASTALLSFWVGNTVKALVSLGASLAITSFSMNVVSLIWPTYRIDALAAILFVFLVAILMVKYAFRNQAIEDFNWKIATAISVGLTLIVLPNRQISRSEALSFVAGASGYSEDNGAWLVALSRMSLGDATVISHEGSFAGGNTTALMLGVFREAAGLVSSWFTSTPGDGAKLLLSQYLVLCLGVSYLAAIVMRKWAARLSSSTRGMEALASVSVFAFTLGLVENGHFSALVAALFLMLALVIGLVDDGVQKPLLVKGLVATCLFAAGQAWLPLIPLASIYVVWTTVDWIRSVAQNGLASFVRYLVVVLGVMLLVADTLFSSYFRTFPNLDYVLYNLRLAGGTASMRVELLILIVVIAIAGLHQRKDLLAERESDRLVAALVGTWIFLVLLSLAVEPYQLQYGVLKYSYIVGLVLLPQAIGWFVGICSGRHRYFPSFALALLAVTTLALFDSQGSRWNLLWKVDLERWEWAEGIARAAELSSGNTVACVTMDSFGKVQENYESYLCNRISFGLMGLNTDEHRLWTAAQVCEVDPVDWSPTFLNGLSVVVEFADLGKPCGESDSSKLNPFSKIDWTTVKLFGSDGNLIRYEDLVSRVE